ncbi:chromatin associated protein KTI12 [Rhizodiscina lignyota]|uniref:Chromatin associated protein KTI12 n=1 Tax=Rhizodiscina lignyota TaxID=1504668 RepID=A0A9P4INU6_9PEZI|nr:chromatin associated protein KTI12 [Rhizodiscina lignyota]
MSALCFRHTDSWLKLIVISGFPCSGKTHRAKQIQEDFESRLKDDRRFAKSKLHLINDESLGVSHDAYQTARTEKDARAAEMSAVKRHLSRDDIVIADGLNYIKGFRYQLYCEAKALQTPSCVVKIHIGTPIDTCRTTNQSRIDSSSPHAYDTDTFENLIFRYEEPNGMTRWDSPLFTVVNDDLTPPFSAIWDTLLGSSDSTSFDPSKAGRKVLVRPNAATVLAPASENDFLYALDRETSAVISTIQTWQKEHSFDGGGGGGEVAIEGAEEKIQLPAGRTLGVAELQRVRRQFVQMMRAQGMGGAGTARARMDKGRIRGAFVGHLNGLWEEE